MVDGWTGSTVRSGSYNTVAQFDPDSRSTSVTHVCKAVSSPNESAFLDSNMCSHSYGVVITYQLNQLPIGTIFFLAKPIGTINI